MIMVNTTGEVEGKLHRQYHAAKRVAIDQTRGARMRTERSSKIDMAQVAANFVRGKAQGLTSHEVQTSPLCVGS